MRTYQFATLAILAIWLAVVLPAQGSPSLSGVGAAYVHGLKPVDSGSGIIIGEAVPNHADVATADFAAACSYWLQVVVGGDGRLGKTPLISDIGKARYLLHKKNMRLSPAEVPAVARLLGVTNVATASIRGDASRCVLTYRLWTSTGTPAASPLVLSGSYAEVLSALPRVARTLVSRLGGDGDRIPTTVAATPSDMIGIGENQRDYDALSTPDQIAKWRDSAQRTSIAGLCLIDNGVVEPGVVGELITQANGNGYILGYLRFSHPKALPSPDAAIAGGLEKYPHNYDLLRGDIEVQYTARDFAKARKDAEMSVRAAPRSPWAWIELGRIIYDQANGVRRGRFFSAMADKETKFVSDLYPLYVATEEYAVQLDPSNSYAWSELSRAAAFDGDGALADQALTKAIQINPLDSANYEWGLQIYQPKWYDNPAKLFKIARGVLASPRLAELNCRNVLNAYLDAEITPDIRRQILIPALSTELADSQRDGGDPTNRVSSALQAAKSHPADPAAWTRLGVAADRDGDDLRRGRFWGLMTGTESRLAGTSTVIGVTARNIAVTLKPSDAAAWLSLSESQALWNLPDDARYAFGRSLALDPNNIGANRWGLQLFQPKWKGTQSDLVDFVQSLQAKPDLFTRLSPLIVDALTASIDNYKTNSAQRETEDKTEQSADDKREQSAEDLLAKAKAAIDVLIKENPQTASDQWDLGEYFTETNQQDNATAAYQSAVKLDPENVVAEYSLASAYYRQQKYDEAIGVYNTALKLDPDDGDALFYLSVLLINQKQQYAEAEAHLRHLLEVEPTRAGAYYWLGLALEDTGDISGARQAWGRAVDLDPNNHDEGDDARRKLAETATSPAASIRGLTSEEQRMVDAWKAVNAQAIDIAVGANGAVWVAATYRDTGKSAAFHWVDDKWQAVTIAARRIAVDPAGNAWIAAADGGQIYRWNGTAFDKIDGMATDIGIGADGSIWMVATGAEVNGGYPVCHWNGKTWDSVQGTAVRIAVDVAGSPWIVNSANTPFHLENGAWSQLPGAGLDIGVGANGAVWLVGVDNTEGAHAVFTWKESRWNRSAIVGVAVSVGPDGLPWTIDANGEIEAGSSSGPTTPSTTSSAATLSQAVSNGDYTGAEQLLKDGADANAQTPDGQTLLTTAVRKGDVRMAAILFSHGAHPDAPDAKGYTPLVIAVLANDTKMMSLLLDNGAKIGLGTVPVNELPLMYAAVSSDPATVEFLIQHGADVNQRDSENSTTLLWAAHAGRLDNIGVLLKHGADPNTHNIRNNTAISLASLIQRNDIVDALRKAGEQQ